MVSIPLENFWKSLPFLTSGSCWAAPSHLMKQWVFMANWFTFPASHHSSILFCRALQTSLPYSDHLEQSSKFPLFGSRSLLDPFSDPRHPKLNASDITSYSRSAMVGWCQHNIWHQCCNSKLLGNLEVVTRFPGGPEAAVWHWLGRGCSNRAWCGLSSKQGSYLQHQDKLYSQTHIFTSGLPLHLVVSDPCTRLQQHLQHSFKGRCHWLSKRFPIHPWPSIYSFTNSIYQQADILEMLALMDPSISWLVTRLWDILPPLFVQTVRWTNTSGNLICLSIRWDLFIWWSNLIDYLDFLGRKVFPYM